jgi:hypothetical protein
MIDALLAGRLYGASEERTSQAGTYAVAKVRTTTSSGEVVFISVIAFNPQPVAALLSLSNGDSVALSGEFMAVAWLDKSCSVRPSIDLLAHHVLSMTSPAGTPDEATWVEAEPNKL